MLDISYHVSLIGSNLICWICCKLMSSTGNL